MMEMLVFARGSGPAMRVLVDRLGRYRHRRAGVARAMHAAGHPDHAIARALGIRRRRVPGLLQEEVSASFRSPDQIALFADPNPEPIHA